MSTKTSKPNGQTKADKILKLLQRNTGASVAELTKVTGGQKHSVYGFISGTLKKRLNLEIKSAKEHNKDGRYFIEGNVR
jgi:hypothetical protein